MTAASMITMVDRATWRCVGLKKETSNQITSKTHTVAFTTFFNHTLPAMREYLNANVSITYAFVDFSEKSFTTEWRRTFLKHCKIRLLQIAEINYTKYFRQRSLWNKRNIQKGVQNKFKQQRTRTVLAHGVCITAKWMRQNLYCLNSS